MSTTATPELLLVQARSGDAGARGRLLELYRNYLRLLARTVMGAAVRLRLDPSDLFAYVYAEPTAQLREQRADLLQELRDSDESAGGAR